MKEETLFNRYFDNQKKDELAVFCGAGISVNSGIPQVLGKNGLIPVVFKALQLTEEESTRIIQKDLPFESIIETLLSYGPKITPDVLFNIFDNEYLQAQPNHTHLYLAEQMYKRKISTILTTNFDTLIETALNRLTERDPSFSYTVYNTMDRQACTFFGNCDWQEDKPRLIKVHGCITRKEELVITIAQIAKQKYQTIRRRLVRDFFGNRSKHNKVVVMGYSCSDSLDIVPYLQNIRNSDKRILYINHNGYSDPNENRKLHQVVDVRKTPSYRKKLALRRRQFSLKGKQEDALKVEKELLPRNPFRHLGSTNDWWFTDTDQVIRKLYTHGIEESHCINWQPIVREWSNNAKYKESWAAGLLELAAETKLACAYRETLYKLFYRKRISLNKVIVFRNYATHISAQGDYRQAIRIHLHNLKSLKKIDPKESIHTPIELTSLADAYSNLSKFVKARKYYQKAFDFYSEVKNYVGLADVYNNLALLEIRTNNVSAAIAHYEQALNLYKIAGSVQGIGLIWSNLGGAWAASGNKKKAVKYYHKARNLAGILADQFLLDNLLKKEAYLLQDQGKHQQAIDLLWKVEKRYNFLNQQHGLFLLRLSVIKSYGIIGQPKKERYYLTKAKKYLKKYATIQTKIEYELALIDYLKRRGLLQNALKISQKVLRITVNSEDLDQKQRLLGMIVDIKRQLGFQHNLIPEIHQLRSADLSRHQDDPQSMNLKEDKNPWWLIQLGDQHFDTDKRKAKKFYHKSLAHVQRYDMVLDEGIMYEKIGRLLGTEKKLKSSEKYYLKAIEKLTSIDTPANLAYALLGYAEILSNYKYDYLTALKITRRAMLLYKQTENEKGMGDALFQLAFNQFMLRGNPQEAIDLIEQAQTHYRQAGCLARIAKLDLTKSWYKVKLGSEAEALNILERSRRQLAHVGNKLNLAENYALSTELNFSKEKKFKYCKNKAVKLFLEINRQDQIARLYNQVANCYTSVGSFAKALKYYQDSLSINASLKNDLGEGEALMSISDLYYKRGEYRLSKESMQRSLRLLEKTNAPGLFNIYWRLAELVIVVDNNLEKGLYYNKKAMTLANKSKEDFKKATAMGNHGDYLARKQENYHALYYLNRSKNLLKDLKWWDKFARISLKISRIKFLQNLQGEAEKVLKEISPWLDKIDDSYVTYHYFLYRAWLHSIKKEYVESKGAISKALSVAKNSRQKLNFPHALVVAGGIATSEKEYDLAEGYFLLCADQIQTHQIKTTEGDLFKSRGLLYIKKGDLKQAKSYLRRSFFLFNKTYQQNDQCFAANQLAQICLHQRKFDQAASWVEKWIEIGQYVDQSELGYAHYWEAVLYQKKGDNEHARLLFNKSRSLLSGSTVYKKVGYYLKTFDQLYINRCEQHLGLTSHDKKQNNFQKRLKKYRIEEEDMFLFENIKTT